MPHFGFEADGKGFFGELLHGHQGSFRRKAGLESGRSGISAAEAGFSGWKACGGTVLRRTHNPKPLRRPLKARDFITALYCRDSCSTVTGPGSLFFAARKPVCYIS